MDTYVQLRKRDGQICPVEEERWADTTHRLSLDGEVLERKRVN